MSAMRQRRTATPNNAPANGSLQPGELAVEMASVSPRLWVGVDSVIDGTGRRLVVDSSQFALASALANYLPLSSLPLALASGGTGVNAATAGAALDSLGGFTGATAGFVRRTAAGTYTLDTTVYTGNAGTVTSVTAGNGLATTPAGGITGTGSIGISAPISIANGGTNATDAAGARTQLGITQANLGGPFVTSVTSGAGITLGGTATAPSVGLTVPISLANGGTNATDAAGARTQLGITQANLGGPFLPLSGGTIYNAGFSDPLRIEAGGGNYARVQFNVQTVGGYSVGTGPANEFGVWQGITGVGTPRLWIDAAGAATIPGYTNLNGGAQVYRTISDPLTVQVNAGYYSRVTFGILGQYAGSMGLDPSGNMGMWAGPGAGTPFLYIDPSGNTQVTGSLGVQAFSYLRGGAEVYWAGHSDVLTVQVDDGFYSRIVFGVIGKYAGSVGIDLSGNIGFWAGPGVGAPFLYVDPSGNTQITGSLGVQAFSYLMGGAQVSWSGNSDPLTVQAGNGLYGRIRLAVQGTAEGTIGFDPTGTFGFWSGAGTGTARFYILANGNAVASNNLSAGGSITASQGVTAGHSGGVGLTVTGPNGQDNWIAYTMATRNWQMGVQGTGDGRFALYDNSAGAFRIQVLPNGSCWNDDGSWNATSDRRVKSGIKPYRRGLNALVKLDPVSFRYNGRGGTVDDGTRHYGLVADDVADAVPEAVQVIMDDIKGHSPTHLTYVMINSIKELVGRLEKLEREVKNGGSR